MLVAVAILPTAAHAGVEVGIELASEAFAWVSAHARAILAIAYERAPALVAVLGALFIVPLVALVALLAHGLNLGWRRRSARSLALAMPTSGGTPVRVAMPQSREDAPWPAKAWLSIDGGPKTPLPPAVGLVRIGRHEDNDIRLMHASVHRHHALIHRTPEATYVVMDLSGQGGNGVRINGERLGEARLVHGDTISLGDIQIRFETAPV